MEWASEDKYFKTLTQAELWQRYCGFLDLSLNEFLSIQHELLLDQLKKIKGSILAKKIIGPTAPETIDDYRRIVSLTTYKDYAPYLSQRQAEALATPPLFWVQSPEISMRWFPYSPDFVNKIVRTYISCLILASAKKKGQINLSPGSRLLSLISPTLRSSDVVIEAVARNFSHLKLIPEATPLFSTDLDKYFSLIINAALKEVRLDYVIGNASLLKQTGGKFSEYLDGIAAKHIIHLHHFALSWVRSKANKRSERLPRHVFKVKAVITPDRNAEAYSKEIAYYWGLQPYVPYGLPEAYLLALPDWEGNRMVFLPDLAFLEFLPQEQMNNVQQSPMLINEVKEGAFYEVVITHFYGMPLLRYRSGDIVQVVSQEGTKSPLTVPGFILVH